MNAKEVIRQVKEQCGIIRQVYWTACGGSLVDLYPAHCMLMGESTIVESGFYTAREFLLATPKKLGKESLVVVCSHSGGTPESLHAAELALEKGAAVVMLTNRAGSPADSDKWITWVYPWADELETLKIPSGITLSLAAEVLATQEEFASYDALMDGLSKMDGIVAKAKEKVRAELCDRFAQLCKDHNFLLYSRQRRHLFPDIRVCHLQPDGDAVAELRLHPQRRVFPRPLRGDRGRRVLFPAEGLR